MGRFENLLKCILFWRIESLAFSFENIVDLAKYVAESRACWSEDENFSNIEETSNLSEHILRELLHVAFHDLYNDNLKFSDYLTKD